MGASGVLPDTFLAADRAGELIDGFRYHFRSRGHRERGRKPLVSRHDSSIRFTNSTISVFKPDLADDGPSEDLLLIQPALRLRNLLHWQRHGTVSGFGCYFIALGTLSPAGSAPRILSSVADWLREGAGVSPDRVVVRVSSGDHDLHTAAVSTGLEIELDGQPHQRYRHGFGLDGVRGRNVNLAVRTRAGLEDVCNVITIEREDGVQLAVESAFGVNTVLARVHDLPHVLVASAAAVPGAPDDLMAIDAAGSAIALLSEGLRPHARGRAGNLRSLLAVLTERIAHLGRGTGARDWLTAAVAAEYRIREHLSPEVAGTTPVPATETVRLLAEYAGLSQEGDLTTFPGEES